MTTKEATDLGRSVADVMREHLLLGEERVPMIQGLTDEAVLAAVSVAGRAIPSQQAATGRG